MMETCASCGRAVPADVAWYDCGQPICPICFDAEHGTDLADRDDDDDEYISAGEY